jgi:hypothetical protein
VTGAGSDTVQKLPFWGTIRETFQLSAQHLAFLAHISWKWIALAGSLAVAGPALIEVLPIGNGFFPVKWMLRAVVDSVCRMMCLAAIAVPWHRHIFTPDANAHPVPTRLIFIYGGTAAAMELPFVVIGVVHFFSLNVGLTVAVAILYLYLWGRLVLILPALALGRDASFTHIFWAGIFVFVPFALTPLVLEAAGLATSFPGWVATALGAIYFSVAALVGIVFLSITYRDLVLTRETQCGGG